MPEDSRAFLDMIQETGLRGTAAAEHITEEEWTRFNAMMDAMIRDNSSFTIGAGRALDVLGENVGVYRLHSAPAFNGDGYSEISTEEDDISYRRRILAVGKGIPEEILKEPKEKLKPKLLTRFQLLKGQYA